MKTEFKIICIIIFTMSMALMSIGCGKDKNPLSAFEPEVINTADAFQFQITDASNVTTSVRYNWNNSEIAASIDHSSATASGSAVVTVFDANNSQVYSSALLASGVDNTATGTAGVWTIVVVFSDFNGSANFRLEKLTP